MSSSSDGFLNFVLESAAASEPKRYHYSSNVSDCGAYVCCQQWPRGNGEARVVMYREVNSTLRLLIRVQWSFIAILCVVVLGLWSGWKSAPRDITLHLPPDIRNGAHMKIDEVAPSNVYTFTNYIFQQLNSWPKSGAEDYGANIWRLSAFFTDAFQQALLRDLDERGHRGELAYRKRASSSRPAQPTRTGACR